MGVTASAPQRLRVRVWGSMTVTAGNGQAGLTVGPSTGVRGEIAASYVGPTVSIVATGEV